MSDYDNDNNDGDDENTSSMMVEDEGHLASPTKKRRKGNGKNGSTTSTKRHTDWNAYYEELVLYKSRHNQKLSIPRKYVTPSGVRLGHWASYQRQNLKPHLDKMDDWNDGVVKMSTTDKVRRDRINRLKAIEFPFTLRPGPEKGKAETKLTSESKKSSSSNTTPSKSSSAATVVKKKKQQQQQQSHVQEESRPTTTTTGKEEDDSAAAAAAAAASDDDDASKSSSGGAPIEKEGDPGTNQKINRKREREALAFDEYFHELEIYKKEHQNLNIPQKYKTPTGIELGKWSHNQRKILKPHLDKYKDENEGDGKEKKTLTAVDKIRRDRIRRLNSLDFQWTLRTFSKSRPWEEYFELALQYLKENNDLRIRHTYKTPGTGINLGEWAQNQRSSYSRQQRGKQSTDQYNISQERIDRLNEIGFPWSLGRGRKRGREKAEPKSESPDHDTQREEEEEEKDDKVDLAASHKDGSASPSHHQSERQELAEQDKTQPAISQQQDIRSVSSMDHVESSQNQQKSTVWSGPVESVHRQLAPPWQPNNTGLQPLIESRFNGKDGYVYAANSKSTMIMPTTIGAMRTADVNQERFYQQQCSMAALGCGRSNGSGIPNNALSGLTLLADVAMAYGLPNDQGHDRA